MVDAQASESGGIDGGQITANNKNHSEVKFQGDPTILGWNFTQQVIEGGASGYGPGGWDLEVANQNGAVTSATLMSDSGQGANTVYAEVTLGWSGQETRPPFPKFTRSINVTMKIGSLELDISGSAGDPVYAIGNNGFFTASAAAINSDTGSFTVQKTDFNGQLPVGGTASVNADLGIPNNPNYPPAIKSSNGYSETEGPDPFSYALVGSFSGGFTLSFVSPGP